MFTLTPYSTDETARLAGVSFRQLDHWCRQGAIRPIHQPCPGSGARRAFTDTEVRLVRVVARLRWLGASIAEAGEHAARLRDLPDDQFHGWVDCDGRIIDLDQMR